jgi:hypothetical protein
MAKETYYFSHDYSARSDVKIKKLLMKHGAHGYGLFWMLVEDLYNNANALPTEYDSIAFDLRSDKKVIESIINDFDLFVVKDSYFGSKSIESRLEQRALKSKKARESANKRWANNANALQTQSDSNAIKERKGKERIIKDIKINDINERKAEFKNSLQSLFLNENDLNDFYLYWTEHGKNDKKMRFEKEKSFGLERRVTTWLKNKEKFSKNKNEKLTGAQAFLKQFDI